MGSRYDDGYHSSVGRAGVRWDAQKFSRESEERYSGPPDPVMERERDRFDFGRRYVEPHSPPCRAERIDDRFYQEKYGPPARRPERQYYDDDDFYMHRGPPVRGAMVPFSPRRPEDPPRPGLLRRQSSLDTFDRRPMRRDRPFRRDDYDDYDDYDDHDDLKFRPRGPPVIPIPVPPSRSPPRYSRPSYDREYEGYAESDYEGVGVAEPEYYGDERFRGYKEREWTRRRSRNRDRNRSASSSSTERETVQPKPDRFRRRGKTKIPNRLVRKKVLNDLGYPFIEEGDMIIVQEALGKDNIDEIVRLSRELREQEGSSTIHVIKSPPEDKAVEEIIERKITTMPISEAPSSVRDWDNLKVESVRSTSPKGRSHSRHTSRSRRDFSPDSSPKERIIERIIREVSPERTSHSRRKSSVHGTEIIERIKRREVEDDLSESNSIHAGPLALVVDRRPKSQRPDFEDEIDALRKERRALRKERERSRYRDGDRDIIIAQPPPKEVVEVTKDKKTAPDPRILRAMLATLT